MDQKNIWQIKNQSDTMVKNDKKVAKAVFYKKVFELVSKYK